MFINSDKMASAAKLGRDGEEIAAIYLERCLGWKVIGRNERTKYGELDIIATENNTIVFVEVKTRSSVRFGNPVEAVTPHKLQKLTKEVHAYLSKHQAYSRHQICIDVIGILLVQHQLVSLQHVRVLPERL